MRLSCGSFLIVVPALSLGIGCSSAPPGQQATVEAAWVGSVSTEGDVTTVVNESGTVWGSGGRLVEELSIGVEAGDEPYLLGDVAGVGVTGGRIYVLDAQIHRVRVYDDEGAHLFDFGSEGDGPGEFRDMTRMAVGADRVFVGDRRRGRITVYTLDGELVDTWPAERISSTGPEMVVGDDGTLFLPTRQGMVPWGPEGAAGGEIPFPAPAEPPPTLTVRVTQAIPGYSPGALIGRAVPFWPLPVAAMAGDGSVIQGAADGYRFAVDRPDGSTLVVERAVDPVPVGDAEAEWHASRVRAHLGQADVAWQWDGPPVPDHKPPYTAFLPASAGEIWVLRPGPGYHDTSCPVDIPAWDPPEECWKDRHLFDVFGPDGRYRGGLDVPGRLLLEPQPVIDGDALIGAVHDEAGTVMVKRYRLIEAEG